MTDRIASAAPLRRGRHQKGTLCENDTAGSGSDSTDGRCSAGTGGPASNAMPSTANEAVGRSFPPLRDEKQAEMLAALKAFVSAGTERELDRARDKAEAAIANAEATQQAADAQVDGLRHQIQALEKYVQHLDTCPTRQNGRRWEPNYTRQRGRWWGAWLPDSTAEYECTCGLSRLIGGHDQPPT